MRFQLTFGRSSSKLAFTKVSQSNINISNIIILIISPIIIPLLLEAPHLACKCTFQIPNLHLQWWLIPLRLWYPLLPKIEADLFVISSTTAKLKILEVVDTSDRHLTSIEDVVCVRLIYRRYLVHVRQVHLGGVGVQPHVILAQILLLIRIFVSDSICSLRLEHTVCILVLAKIAHILPCCHIELCGIMFLWVITSKSIANLSLLRAAALKHFLEHLGFIKFCVFN